MATGMSPKLEHILDAFAAAHGHRSVQAVINRSGTSKPEMGRLLPFKGEPRRYWVDKD